MHTLARLGREASIACTLFFCRTLFGVPISCPVFNFNRRGTSRKCLFFYVLGVLKKSDSYSWQLYVAFYIKVPVIYLKYRRPRTRRDWALVEVGRFVMV